MVNRGRPSKDCAPCRKRKLRCDLNPNGCGQCKRAQIRCFGYRDTNELIFRDQTPSSWKNLDVQENALRRVKRSKLAVAASPGGQLSLSWEAFAREDFFLHYIFGYSRSHESLATLYEETKPGSHLHVAVDAASLAFLSVRHPNCPTLYRLATKSYVDALHLLNGALADPFLAPNDETLQAVLLLDLYEKLANRNHKSTTAWMNHMNGAVALVQTRGQRNLHTKIGQHLAKRLFITLVISCVVAGIRVPRSLDRLKRQLDDIHSTDDIKWAVTGINMKMINFAADRFEGVYSTDEGIAAEAARLDNELFLLEKSVPISWRPTKVHAASSAISRQFVLEDHFDVYKSLYVTQVMNVMRISRVQMHLLIERGSASRRPALASRILIEKMARDICASVPQFIPTDTDTSGTATSFTPIQQLRCYALLAPLYLAGKNTTDTKVREWVVNFLTFLSQAANLEMAHKLVTLLKDGSKKNFWEVYAMLGSYAFAA